MTLKEFLLDAKKAVGALTTVEATAVGLGLLSGPVAGYVTAGLGVVTSLVVYLLDNESPARPAAPAIETAATPRARD